MADNSRPDVSPQTPPATSGGAAGPEKAATAWFVPVATAVALLSAFCLYYFVYVKAQREYLANRNFRALAALGDQLRTMITIHGSILEFYADLANPRTHGDWHGRTKIRLPELLVHRPEDKELGRDARYQEERKDYLKYLAPSLELADTPHTARLEAAQPGSRIQVRRHNGRWEVAFTALQEKGDLRDCSGSLELESALRPLVGSLPFADILLASENGTIIYQNKKAGPQFTTLTALLDNQIGGAEKKPASGLSGAGQTPEARSAPASASHGAENGARQIPINLNEDQAWRTRSMHLTDLTLAGTRYRLFLQPVLIDVFSDVQGRTEPSQEWVLCGLTSSAALEWEALAISYTFIIWLTVLFFAICMGGPILKLFFLNRRERLPLRELAFLGLFLVLLSGVFTLSGLQAVYFHLNDDETERGLQQLGDNLSTNIHHDLKGMRDQLQALCRNVEGDLRNAAEKEVIRKANAVEPQLTIYPDFNNAFWTDDDGHQIVKWSMTDYFTPMIDVSHLDVYTHPKTIYLDGGGPPFHFDSVLPPNKLEYLATLTMSTCECDPRLCQHGTPIRGDITAGSAFLTAQPFSLINAILPFGYGFALVDQTGLVLFHVDKTRNMRENFRQESDWSKELYAATFGHAAQRSLRIKYLGKDYRARVVPVTGVSQSPWSLIVYRDLTSVRTLNLQAMTMASTLFLLVLLGPALAIAIWCAVHRPQFAPEWLWPHRARMATYGYQISIYASLIVLFMFLGFRASSEETVIACAAVPYTAWLLTFWCFRLHPCPAEEREKSSRALVVPAALSGLAAIVFLVVLVVQWPHFKDLTFLLGFGAIAVVALLDKPRDFLTNRFNRRHSADGAGHQSRLEPGWLSYKACHALSVQLLLLLVGVLTPMALFRASLGVERRLQTKRAQLHLASALEQRQVMVGDQCDRQERSEALCAKFRGGAPTWSEVGLASLFASDGTASIKRHSPASGEEIYVREIYSDWFRRLIYLLHHDYNDAAAEMLGVIPDRGDRMSSADFPDWSWVDEESTVTLRSHGLHPPPQGSQPQLENDLLITSNLTAFHGNDTLTAIAVATGVMLLMGGIFWGLARKIFLFHIAPLKISGARQVAESISAGRNVLVLVPPVSKWQLDAPKWTMDLAAVATAPKWAELLDLDTVPMNTVIEIQHFEYSASDPEIDNQKLVLLLRLMQRENTQIAAVMTVDASPKDYRRMFPGLEVADLREEPFTWLKEYEGPARDLIWKECGPMPALWPIGAQLAKDIKNENVHSEDTIASEILERADPYYQLVWKECSKEQKFVLVQLAQDGLINPANGRSIRQLMRRGLITKDPQFCVMNESFRRFLRSAAAPELKQEWLRESRGSGWGKMHNAFFTIMIFVGAFLLTTQNELWQSAAAYVTTAFGALGTFAKLFNTVRGGGITEKAS